VNNAHFLKFEAAAIKISLLEFLVCLVSLVTFLIFNRFLIIDVNLIHKNSFPSCMFILP